MGVSLCTGNVTELPPGGVRVCRRQTSLSFYGYTETGSGMRGGGAPIATVKTFPEMPRPKLWFRAEDTWLSWGASETKTEVTSEMRGKRFGEVSSWRVCLCSTPPSEPTETFY
jgi:hypothetical protein